LDPGVQNATVLGCLLLGVLNNGLVLLEGSTFWQQVIKKGVSLGAIPSK
jgi:ribose transport system permease protein